MDVSSLIYVALFIVLLSIWFGKKKGIKNPLPGPSGLPIVGYLPFLTSKPYVKLTELAKTYGPVYSVRLGSKDIVVLCDFKSIKEAFASDDFMGRPPDLPFDLSDETKRTGAFLDMAWKEQRRFSLHVLRDLGFGKTRMEEHMKEEILEIVERISEFGEKPVKMSDLLAPSTSNNIASLLFGKRLKHDNPRRQELDHLLNDIGQFAGSAAWQTFFPWIRALLTYFSIGDQGKLSRALEDVRDYCKEETKEHEATLDPSNIRDFTDGYLLEIQKRSGDPDTGFKKDVLADVARGFFGAGSETVRISIDWMLLMCAAFPELQKKIHYEIDEVLGRDRFPTGQDRINMPFTEAATWELMRWKSILPLNIMRYTLKDTTLNGYFIPKHTDVLAVLWAVDHDKALWGDDVFAYKPERFLSKDGQKVVKPEYSIPFSIGKRSCPGKSLAEIEVFLYLTAILQKFEISLPPGKKADLEGILGIGLQPKRQELCLKKRF